MMSSTYAQKLATENPTKYDVLKNDLMNLLGCLKHAKDVLLSNQELDLPTFLRRLAYFYDQNVLESTIQEFKQLIDAQKQNERENHQYIMQARKNAEMNGNLMSELHQMQSVINYYQSNEGSGSGKDKLKKQIKELREECLRRDVMVKDKDDVNAMLRKEIEDLKCSLNETQQNEKYLNHQISKKLSMQEYERTDPHENLNDQFKPSNIVGKSNELYREVYGDVIDKLLDDDHDEDDITDNLLKIYMLTFKRSKRAVEQYKGELLSKLKITLTEFPLSQKDRKLPKHFEVDVCAMLRESPDSNIKAQLVDDVFSRCKFLCKSSASVDSLKKYITACIDVTWLMAACMPPMVLSTDGDVFDTSKHIRAGGQGNHIERFLWPCIYFSEAEFAKGKVFGRGYVIKVDRNKPRGVHPSKKDNSRKEIESKQMSSLSNSKNETKAKQHVPQQPKHQQRLLDRAKQSKSQIKRRDDNDEFEHIDDESGHISEEDITEDILKDKIDSEIEKMLKAVNSLDERQENDVSNDDVKDNSQTSPPTEPAKDEVAMETETPRKPEESEDGQSSRDGSSDNPRSITRHVVHSNERSTSDSTVGGPRDRILASTTVRLSNTAAAHITLERQRSYERYGSTVFHY